MYIKNSLYVAVMTVALTMGMSSYTYADCHDDCCCKTKCVKRTCKVPCTRCVEKKRMVPCTKYEWHDEVIQEKEIYYEEEEYEETIQVCKPVESEMEEIYYEEEEYEEEEKYCECKCVCDECGNMKEVCEEKTRMCPRTRCVEKKRMVPCTKYEWVDEVVTRTRCVEKERMVDVTIQVCKPVESEMEETYYEEEEYEEEYHYYEEVCADDDDEMDHSDHDHDDANDKE